jgi:hypothetical protein
MGPLLLSMVGGVAAAAAGHVFNRAGAPKNSPGVSSGDPTKGTEKMSLYDNDDEVGADDIYIETSGDDDDEVGAARARPKAKTKKGRAAFRRIAFLPGTAIATTVTSVLSVVLNAPFKGIGMRMAGANQSLLFFNGAVIRGRPQEGSAGSVGCGIFLQGETFFWEWDTANPGEAFTVSFTNSHTASVAPAGYMIGYLAP